MSSASIWELCLLDANQEECIRTVKAHTKLNVSEDKVSNDAEKNYVDNESNDKSDLDPMVVYSQENLISTEDTCQRFVAELDLMVGVLGEISTAHNAVTGRTNSLMRNCEDLLERQVFFFDFLL